MQKKKSYNSNNILLRGLSILETWSAKNVMGNGNANHCDISAQERKPLSWYYLQKITVQPLLLITFYWPWDWKSLKLSIKKKKKKISAASQDQAKTL